MNAMTINKDSELDRGMLVVDLVGGAKVVVTHTDSMVRVTIHPSGGRAIRDVWATNNELREKAIQ